MRVKLAESTALTGEIREMSLKSLAEDAVKKINQEMAASLSEAELAKVKRIIEHTLVEAARHSTQRCAEAMRVRLGPDADLAHKIADEAERAHEALIANLSSLR